MFLCTDRIKKIVFGFLKFNLIVMVCFLLSIPLINQKKLQLFLLIFSDNK